MRALLQRVTTATVTVDGAVVGAIGPGLCVLIGVTHSDDGPAARKMAERIWNLRIFEDERGVPNLSARDLQRPVLVVSQFTLYADTSRGRRPSYIDAAGPDLAEPLYEAVVAHLRDAGAAVETGRFGATMEVALVNEGPFTIWLEA